MKTDFFINTINFQKMEALCNKLLGPALGVDIAAIVGPPGRGKSTAAERIFSTNPKTVYIYCKEKTSLLELLRDITFKLSGTRPRFREACFDQIADEMSSQRRLIMLDEADRLSLSCLNIARDIQEVYKAPILFIGMESLLRKMGIDSRITSRTREVLKFQPVSQADVIIFFKQAIGQTLAPEHAVKILKSSGGDFRHIKIGALTAENVLGTSDLDAITDKVVEIVCKEIRRSRGKGA